VLESLPGKKAAIQGDMGELGPQGAELHKSVALHIQKKNIDLVIGVGALAVNYSACGRPFHHFETTQQAIASVPRLLCETDSVLVKGSRFLKMELIVNSLKEDEC